MSRIRRLVFHLTLLLPLLWFFAATAKASPDDHFPTTTITKQGQKWRIGYLQGGDYGSYQKSLAAIVQGLMKLGFMETAELPVANSDKETSTLWRWLAEEAKSDFVEFVADGYYDARWDQTTRKQLQEELLQRLNAAQDLDLLLAMGTWAGQDLANDRNLVATLVASTTDPVAAGIIASAETSGRDNLHAKVDPDRHRRQVRLFYDIFRFSKLGLVFEDSVEGRGFSAVDNVMEVAGKLNFSIASCQARFNGISQAEAEASIVACYQQLAPEVDAVYLLRHPGVNLTTLPAILEPLIAQKIPTFAQGLSDEVSHGVLLSISLADFSYVGDFYASTIAKIFNGAKPGRLNQVFINPPKIAINLKTAQLIGYDPSVDIVGAADEIFTEIAPPP